MKKVVALFLGVFIIVSHLTSQSEFDLPALKSFIDKNYTLKKSILKTNNTHNNKTPSDFSFSRETNNYPQFLDSVMEVDFDSSLLVYKYLYNNSNQLATEYVFYIFEGIHIPYMKLVFSYVNDTNIKETILYGMDYSSQQWFQGYIIEYNYNSLHFLESEYRSEWNDSLEIWMPVEKLEYIHNDFGNLIRADFFSYDTLTTIWNSEDRYTYVYDLNQNLTLFLTQEWNSITNSWDDYDKDESVYNNLGLKTEYVHQKYETNYWQKHNKSEYSHDQNSWLVEENVFSWDNGLNNWKPSRKFENSFDNSGNMIQSTEYIWKTDSLKWMIDRQHIRSYNTEYSIDELILPWHCYLFGFGYHTYTLVSPYYNFDYLQNLYADMLLSTAFQRWNETDSIWETKSSKQYYYSDHITGNPEISNINQVTLYPNPAYDFVIIDIDNNLSSFNFDLYDLLGGKVLSIKNASKKINIENIPSGMYTYTIGDKEKQHTGKLIISK